MPPKPKQLDEAAIEAGAAINFSMEEIAARVGCSVDTLNRRYAEVIQKGRALGRASLKKKMWDIAMAGDKTMLIWLSKQMLGYSDKIEHVDDAGEKIKIVYTSNWGSNIKNGETKS